MDLGNLAAFFQRSMLANFQHDFFLRHHFTLKWDIFLVENYKIFTQPMAMTREEKREKKREKKNISCLRCIASVVKHFVLIIGY